MVIIIIYKFSQMLFSTKLEDFLRQWHDKQETILYQSKIWIFKCTYLIFDIDMPVTVFLYDASQEVFHEAEYHWSAHVKQSLKKDRNVTRDNNSNCLRALLVIDL